MAYDLLQDSGFNFPSQSFADEGNFFNNLNIQRKRVSFR